MAQLLLLGDSQVERVWNHVRGDRDLLRTGLFFPVKSRKAMDAGFKALKATVSLCFNGSYDWFFAIMSIF